MQDDQKLSRNSRFLSYALILVILVGFTAYSAVFKRDDQTVSRLQLNNDATLTVIDSHGKRETVRYADILSAEFFDTPDYGKPSEGAITEGIREGLWISESWGEYTASAAESIPCCVFFRTSDRAYALNLESSAVTRAFFEAVEKVIRENALPPDA